MLQFLLSVGLGLILAPVTVLFTDMPRIVRIALRMGFYATPIIYGVHAAPPLLQNVLLLNPMAGHPRDVPSRLLPARSSTSPSIISSVVITFGTLVAGTIVFKRLEAPVLKEI